LGLIIILKKMKNVKFNNLVFNSALNIEKRNQIKEENDNIEEQEKENKTTEQLFYGIYHKKNKVPIINETNEEILEIPKNALSYLEYKQMQKERIKEINKTINQVKVNETDAQPKIINENEFILGTAQEKKKAKRIKKKALDEKEEDLSYVIQSSLGERDIQSREKKYYLDRKKENKFNFKPEDFPELK